MPYSNYEYNNYNKYFEKRDCRNRDRYGNLGGYRSTYSSNYGRYYGPWEWFPEAANAVLEWFLEPSNKYDHQALYNEIRTGDDIEGFTEYGQKQDGLIKFYVLLCIAALIGGLMFLGGLGWKLFAKKEVDPSNDKKRRVKLVPLFMFHIPVVVLLGVLLAIFSMNLWSLYTGINLTNDHADEAIRGANTDLEKMIRRGKCEYDASVVEGTKVINKQMEEFFTTQLQGCQANERIEKFMFDLRNDKSLVFNLKDSVESIVKQMEELQGVFKSEEQKSEFSKMNKVLIKLRDALDNTSKGFDKVIENADKVVDERKTDTKVLHQKLTDASQELTLSLDEIQTRLKTVIESIHSEITKETDWINVVGKRMMKLKEQVKREGDPLPSYILIQLIIAVPILLAMFALFIAFLALAVRIVYPDAFSKFPGATKKIRRLVTVSFFTQCIFVGFIAFITWVSLNYAASLNVACKPMYSTGYFINPMDNFYKDVLGNFHFKDFEGNDINQTFADAVALSRESGPITNLKKAKLIPKFSELVDFDRWFSEIQKTFKENPTTDIQIEDRKTIAKELQFIIAEFKDQNSVLRVRNSQSQLAKLVAKELDDLARQLNNLSLQSLNSLTIEGCSGKSLDSSIVRTLRSIFDSSIDRYQVDFNQVYYADFIYHSYMGTGRTMCYDSRIPLAGLWLAGTLICVCLLVSALVLFKVAKNLYPVGSEDPQLMSDSTSVSTIYAPLIDGDKNPSVQEI